MTLKTILKKEDGIFPNLGKSLDIYTHAVKIKDRLKWEKEFLYWYSEMFYYHTTIAAEYKEKFKKIKYNKD